MDENQNNKYELIDGYAVVDNNFEIITANEALYKFIGVSIKYTIMNVIHQVDIDDFIDVAGSLKINQKKSMVLRMRRVDNSFRWVLVEITRKEITGSKDDEEMEYLELNISDIASLKNQNKALDNTIKSFRHILAMEDELFYSYEINEDKLSINCFVDNEIKTLISDSLENIKKYFIDNNHISDASLGEFNRLMDNIKKGVVSYTHTIDADVIINHSEERSSFLVNGTTIYDELEPSKSVGSIKNIGKSTYIFNKTTYKYINSTTLLSPKEIYQYCQDNINYNNDCQLTIMYIQIDNLKSYALAKGEEAAKKMYDITISNIKKILGYMGVLGTFDNEHFIIAVKDINEEKSLRAFIEHLRTLIAWKCRLKDYEFNIRFSIAIARYPDNGDLEKTLKKLHRAYNIALEKGGNRYIIYKEKLHGEID